MEMDLWEGLPAEGSGHFDDIAEFCTRHAPEVRKGLPWFAAEIAAADGWVSMLSFIKRQSGAQIYIPPTIEEFNRKYGFAFPPAQYQRLVRLSDDRRSICVPSAWGVYMALRRVALRLALASSNRDRDRCIARRFGASLRYVKKERSRISVGG